MASGFLIFSAGWLAYHAALMFACRAQSWTDFQNPVPHALNLLFQRLHPESYQGQYALPFYAPDVFIAIGIYTLATFFGIAGAVIAQILYATRKDEPAA